MSDPTQPVPPPEVPGYTPPAAPPPPPPVYPPAPDYATPAQSGYAGPEYAAPGYTAPTAPDYAAPGYAAPGLAAPAQPGYGAPMAAAPTGYSYPPGYGYPRRQNNLALVGMILAIVGLGPVGAIMGHVARRQIKERGEDGDGFALAAIIIGWIQTGLVVLSCGAYAILIAVLASNSTYTGGY